MNNRPSHWGNVQDLTAQRKHTLLLDAFEAASPGQRVVWAHSQHNLHCRMIALVERTGFEPWPRLWQNLRASRETELMRQYDLATVCKWIGNSPAVAAKHYAMSADLDADFRRAVGVTDGVGKAQQKAQQSASANGYQAMTTGRSDGGKHPENSGDVADGQLVTIGDESEKWAILDLNQ